MLAYFLNPNHKMMWLTEAALQRIRRELVEVLIWSKVTVSSHELEKEIKQYIRFALRNETMVAPVFDHWNSTEFQFLKIAELRLAACHASSANTEPIFSILKNIATD